MTERDRLAHRHTRLSSSTDTSGGLRDLGQAEQGQCHGRRDHRCPAPRGVITLRDDPDVHAMVLTGRGSAFSAGGDFDTIRAMREDRHMRDAVLDAHQELFR